MKKALVPALLIFLHGCAKDNYVALPDGPGSLSRMDSDLASCKDTVLHQYAAAQSGIGAFAAGGIGGVVLGTAAGLVGSQSGTMTPNDIDPAIEQCMAHKGYSGISEN